jgi:hypothetical protein
MTAVLNGRAPRSGVLSSAPSRSFVAIVDDTAQPRMSGHVAHNRSCTPERLRS